MRNAARRLLRAFLVEAAPRLALRHVPLSASEVGRAGESLAARHLRRNGLSIVARRLATGAGEIDLLARDAGTWACVEVKTGRAGMRFRPGQRVDRKRLRRLQAAAQRVARETGEPARVDLVEVSLDRRGAVTGVVHVRNLCPTSLLG